MAPMADGQRAQSASAVFHLVQFKFKFSCPGALDPWLLGS